jgi:5-methylcytosine-specific restriction endonuclease McrA
MTQFIFWRSGSSVPVAACDPLELEGMLYFQLSQRRISPYGVLQDADTLYLREEVNAEHRLVWEFRSNCVLEERYSSHVEIFSYLEDAYGVGPEELNLSDYVFGREQAGYLIAWAIDVIAPMSVRLPTIPKLGDLGFRNGIAPLATLPRSYLDSFAPQLPRVGREPSVRSPQCRRHGSLPFPTTQSRYITEHVRHQVLERDGYRCRYCDRGRPEVSLHIDHIRPFTLGGGSVVHNLQVLCAHCNLSKGSRILGQVPPPTWDPSVMRQTQARIDALRATMNGLDREDGEYAAFELCRLDPAMPDAERIELLELASLAKDPRVSAPSHVQLGMLIVEVDEHRAMILWRKALESGVDPAAGEAAYQLGLTVIEADPGEGIPLFREALRCTDPEVVAAAAYILIRSGEDIVDFAIWKQALNAVAPKFRCFAALELATLEIDSSSPNEAVIPLLRMALGSPDEDVTRIAVAELETLEGAPG